MGHAAPATPERAPLEHRVRWTMQLRALTRAIELDPDAPVNYVLRGEEWLMGGAFERARADFEAARVRAQRWLEHSAWGYIYQAYIDRADAGLRQCK